MDDLPHSILVQVYEAYSAHSLGFDFIAERNTIRGVIGEKVDLRIVESLLLPRLRILPNPVSDIEEDGLPEWRSDMVLYLRETQVDNLYRRPGFPPL